MGTGTLLIVDDEKPTRDGLRGALEDRFDVLLTDVRLPNEDGMSSPRRRGEGLSSRGVLT